MAQQIVKNPFNGDFYSLLKAYVSEDYRRVGKSFNMIRILVELSIETQRPVNFIDHSIVQRNTQRGVDHLNSILRDVVGYYLRHGIKLQIYESTTKGFGVSLLDGYENYKKIRFKNVITEEDSESLNQEEFLLLLIN